MQNHAPTGPGPGASQPLVLPQHTTSDLLRLLAAEGMPFGELAASVAQRFGDGADSQAWLARTLVTLLRDGLLYTPAEKLNAAYLLRFAATDVVGPRQALLHLALPDSGEPPAVRALAASLAAAPALPGAPALLHHLSPLQLLAEAGSEPGVGSSLHSPAQFGQLPFGPGSPQQRVPFGVGSPQQHALFGVGSPHKQHPFGSPPQQHFLAPGSPHHQHQFVPGSPPPLHLGPGSPHPPPWASVDGDQAAATAAAAAAARAAQQHRQLQQERQQLQQQQQQHLQERQQLQQQQQQHLQEQQQLQQQQHQQQLQSLQDLLQQAARSPLVPATQQQLAQALQSELAGALLAPLAAAVDGSSASSGLGGLQPHHMQGLVEHNSRVASELLVALARQHPDAAAVYAAAVAELPMSAQSVECMSAVVSQAEVPDWVLTTFLSNCMQDTNSCQDAGRQSRQVKLLSACVELVLRRQPGALAESLPELLAFCIQQSRFKQASELYRQLRDLEQAAG